MNSVTQEIRRRNFDSTLLNTPLLLGGNDPNTCFDLQIYLKVHLRQLNPPRGRADFRVRDHDNNRVLLGLGHSNENSRQCRQNPYSSICYGATLEQELNMMGRGNMLSLEDAQPWKQRIALHTRTRASD
jgi:hypothetical protein